MKMNLQQLIQVLDKPEIKGSTVMDISGIQSDSRKVEAGFLFVAVRGTVVDGHSFMANAIEKGAVAIVCEEIPEGFDPCEDTILTEEAPVEDYGGIDEVFE